MSNNVLITGASSGIGEALALQYASRGDMLFLCGRNSARLLSVADRCRELGATVHAETLDVTDSAAAEAWLKKCNATAPINLVFANAGVGTGEENEKTNSKRHMPLSPSAMFTVALLKIAEIWEQLMCPLMNE